MPILPEKRRTGMRKRLFCTALSILVGGYCLSGTSMAQDSTPILDRGEGAWSSSVLAHGLDYPWDIVRDGERVILTENAGTVVIIEGGNVQRSTLQTSDPLRTEGGAGLLGIALAPDFADSGRAFVYYSYSSGSEPANRVVAARFDGNTWRETAVLVDAIPGHR
ncbi:sorbosone dehydrogenase family protein, partial [Sinorhizobium medicae]|nr:sorbosone dehydrogenase family protein [Sinorhizobium medicae]MDX0828266.1 sorbosone dehydrogenase family protein [Sinorhizobium medicae]